VLAGEVVLKVGRFCVETTARRARERLVAALLSGEASGPAVEHAVDLLEAFLRQSDFRALRAGDPDLAGGRACEVVVSRAADGALEWRKRSG
jgi:hypothetical protein